MHVSLGLLNPNPNRKGRHPRHKTVTQKRVNGAKPPQSLATEAGETAGKDR